MKGDIFFCLFFSFQFHIDSTHWHTFKCFLSVYDIFAFTSLSPWGPWHPGTGPIGPIHYPPLHKRRSKRFHRPAFLVLCCHMSRLALYDFLSASWADLRCQGIIKTMSLYLSLLSSHGLVLRWSHAGADGGVLHCANVSPWLWFLWIWPFDVLWIGKDVSLGKMLNVLL